MADIPNFSYITGLGVLLAQAWHGGVTVISETHIIAIVLRDYGYFSFVLGQKRDQDGWRVTTNYRRRASEEMAYCHDGTICGGSLQTGAATASQVLRCRLVMVEV